MSKTNKKRTTRTLEQTTKGVNVAQKEVPGIDNEQKTTTIPQIIKERINNLLSSMKWFTELQKCDSVLGNLDVLSK